jgi:diguanylate cyclase (GGDEF)-like protein
MASQRRFSIMKKVSLFILVLVVATIFSYGTFVIWQFKHDKLKYIHLVNTSYTASTARKIQSHLESIINDMHNIAGFLRMSGIEQTRSSIIKIIFQNDPALVSFGVYKKTGFSGSKETFTQIYSVYNTDFLELKKLNSKTLQNIDINGLDGYIQSKKKPAEGYYQNQPISNTLTFVFPLDKDQNHFGVFLVNKEFLTSSLGESNVQESALINTSGSVIAQKDETAREKIDSPLYDFAKNSPINQGSTEFKYDQGGKTEEYVGDFFKLGHGLILLTQVDKTKAFLDMRKLIVNTIVFAILITGLGIFAGLLFSRSMTAPLRTLMTATENFAAGNFNFESVNVKTNDELGLLADHFRDLGKKLTAREAELEKVTELAIKDGMTGLFNHRYFISRLESYFGLSKRHKNKTSVCLIDVDFFKKFNDTYGHQQGDLVLQDLAKILMTSVRDTDLVARYGGEEFVVICPETDTTGAVKVAEKIRVNYQNHNIKNLTKIGGEFLKSTCSIGVATFDGTNFPDIAALVKASDTNLYKAKEGGRNCVKA